MLSQPEAVCDLCTAKSGQTSAEFHHLHTVKIQRERETGSSGGKSLNGQGSFACGSDLAGGLRLLPGQSMRDTGGGCWGR
ncbi:hypothetical protein QQF64_028980 [Cirrhinus molitorella]|uniref:Uncharacterized protein n=1 Tax=Cirrhinus molitorella TaxID=172907 RepID=A0ABR3N843_9TELE